MGRPTRRISLKRVSRRISAFEDMVSERIDRVLDPLNSRLRKALRGAREAVVGRLKLRRRKDHEVDLGAGDDLPVDELGRRVKV